MNESNSVDTIDRINLTEQTKFRLDKISEIENYFYKEINQRKSCGKKISKYVAAFDYIDKVLIALSATTNWVSICLFTSVVGAPVGIASASFTLTSSLTTGILKKVLSIKRNKKKKHDKIFMLAKSKLNSIETIISQALIDMEISHEEFIAILKNRLIWEDERKFKKWKWKTRNYEIK